VRSAVTIPSTAPSPWTLVSISETFHPNPDLVSSSSRSCAAALASLVAIEQALGGQDPQ
jgi:hypothetical protein